MNKDDSPDIRSTAATSLGNLKNPGAVELFKQIANDENEYPTIRQSARQ